MKKTKSKSKVEFVSSNNDPEDSDNNSESVAQYDLETAIEESGGIDEFLKTPCIPGQ